MASINQDIALVCFCVALLASLVRWVIPISSLSALLLLIVAVLFIALGMYALSDQGENQ